MFTFTANRKGIKIRVSKIICFAVGVMLAARQRVPTKSPSSAISSDPRGRCNVDGNLYYVGWVSNTLSKWDGKTTTVLNRTPGPGCGFHDRVLSKLSPD
jgi:hypothetical protein